jgi:predicted peroxiredoxin
MAKILVHITAGPNDPTKAALAFLVAKTVLDSGHDLALFVAGDGVYLLTAKTAERTEGLGTGRLSEHLAAINTHGTAAVYFSGMSAKARNIAADQIILQGAQAAMPQRLVELSLECDRVLSY